MRRYDHLDRKILAELQRDASRPIDALGEAVGLSRNAVWRRMRLLEEEGILKERVALVDPAKVGLGLIVFISIKTECHDAEWCKKLEEQVNSLDEILGVYRTSGEQDYLIHARVADVFAYDQLYKRLIANIELKDVSASFVMEAMKETTCLPISENAL